MKEFALTIGALIIMLAMGLSYKHYEIGRVVEAINNNTCTTTK